MPMDETQDIPTIELRDWVLLYADDGETVVRVSGLSYGDLRRRDGKPVITTRIVRAEGRLLATRSGSRYRLGIVHPEFRKHLDVTRPLWDQENPIDRHSCQTAETDLCRRLKTSRCASETPFKNCIATKNAQMR